MKNKKGTTNMVCKFASFCFLLLLLFRDNKNDTSYDTRMKYFLKKLAEKKFYVFMSVINQLPLDLFFNFVENCRKF